MRSTGFGSPEPPPAGPLPATALAAGFGPAWTALESEIRTCRKCPLHASRTNAVIYRGSPTPRLLFVGEAPGATEDRTGVPFVGRSGLRLDAAILGVGLGPSDYGVLNLVKCRPPANRFDRDAGAACRPYL